MFPIRGAPAKQRWPWVTLGLIGANVAVFLYQLHIGPQAAADLFLQKGAVAAKLSHPSLVTSFQAWRLLPTMFSSLFLHGGWVHLIGNLWFLWVFGEALEDDLGHGRFLAFYLFCGFFAGLFHVLASSRLSAPLIGASGAIAGVLGGYLIRLPKSPIRTVVFWRLRPEVLAGAGLFLAAVVAGPAVLRPAPGRAGGLGGPSGRLWHRVAHSQPFHPGEPGGDQARSRAPRRGGEAKVKKK